METINALAGPLGQRLTWTLLHFLWQGAVLAGLLESVIYLCGARSLTARYRLALAALMLMAACPILTFRFVQPAPLITDVPLQPTVERVMPPEMPAAGPPFMLGRTEPSDAPPLAPLETPDVIEAAPSPPPCVSTLARWQPWLLGGWAIGAGLLGLRLLIGGGMAWRMRLSRRPLDPEWADRARRLALRLGVRRAAVFVSARVHQALVAGVWRPMVLLPVAWLAEMPPEMLEGVLAHELAHLRRMDLWAILLQRLVETFLFYHPAVWWLSRRLSREREMCCDEMAVAATGDRLAFTEALQWAAQRPAAGSGPVLGAAWKGSQKMVIERIRRLLGADMPRERFSWWPLGLAALIAPALLMFSALSAKETPPAEKQSDRTPTLAEIAKANDAAWAAIRTVDMEYEATDAIVIDGKKVCEVRSPGLRWSKEGDRERVRGRFTNLAITNRGKFLGSDFNGSFRESVHTNDLYIDGRKSYEIDQYKGRPLCAISPQRPKTDLMRQRLRYVNFDNGRMTLAELIAATPVTIRGKQISKDGETLWLLEADNRASIDSFGENMPPTSTKIYVNAEKGFLISRVEYSVFYLDPGERAVKAVVERRADEVTAFQCCGHGVYFPSTMVTDSEYFPGDPKNADKRREVQTLCATRLLVNSPLPGDALAFRFPDQTAVNESGADGARDMEMTRKVVEDKKDSKSLVDLQQRAQYYFVATDYDKALPAFEAVIAADPNSESAAIAHCACGIIYLSRGRDFARAAAEYSELLRWFEAKSADEKSKVEMDAHMGYLLRGLAYANQADGLDKALADMTTAVESQPGDQVNCCARLIRSAIYLQRNELDKARLDVAVVLHGDFHYPDAYGISSLIFAKQGDRDKADADRLTFAAKCAVLQLPFAGPENAFDHVFGGVLHRTLQRLAPALESLIPVDRMPQATAPVPVLPVASAAAEPTLPTSTAVRIKEVLITGNETNKTSLLKKEAGVKAGGTADPYAVENGRRKIEKYYQDRGYRNAHISILEGNKTGDTQVVYKVDEGSREWVFSIKFVGNTFISSARMKTLIDAHWSYPNFSGEFHPKKVDEDVDKLTAYYRSFGFFQARIGRQIESNEKQNPVRITFIIDEGPRYSVRNISFLGNRKIDNARLVAKCKLRSGQNFDQSQQNLDLQKLRDEYAADGYVFAKIEADNLLLDQPGKLDIVYIVEEGARYRISRLNIETKGENPHTAYNTPSAAKAAQPASHSPASAATVVDVKISALEVDRAKCRTQGFDLDKVLANRDADNHEALVRTLTCDGLAEVITAPHVATVSGCKASVGVVGQLSFDVLPTVVDKDRVRVECHLRINPEELKNVIVANGGHMPLTKPYEFDSRLEMRLGQTVVIAGGRPKSAKGEKEIVVLLTAKLFDGKVGPQQARDTPVSVAARSCLKLTAVDEVGKPIADASLQVDCGDDKATLIAQSVCFYAPVRITAASNAKVSASKNPISFPLPELKSPVDRGEAQRAMTALRGSGELASDAGRPSLSRVMVVLGKGRPGAKIKVVYVNGEEALTADTITLDASEVVVNGLRTLAKPKANEPSTKAPAAKPAEKDKPFVQGFDKDDSRR